MYFKSDICFTHFCGEFEKLKSSYSFLKENILFWLRSTHYPNSKGTEKPNKRMLNHILTIIQMFLCITHDLFWTKGKFLKKKADCRTQAIIHCSCKKKRPLKKLLAFKKLVKNIQATGYNGKCTVFKKNLFWAQIK